MESILYVYILNPFRRENSVEYPTYDLIGKITIFYRLLTSVKIALPLEAENDVNQ